MKNPIKQWLQKRQQKKASKQNLRWLQSVAQQHQWLDQLRTSGLLQWDVVQRRLFIEADLAVLFLQDAQRWTAFIHNTYQWLYYLESQTAVEDYFHQQELKAVREQLNQTTDLSRADIDRIRRTRRMELSQADMPEVRVEPFEFFIIPDSTEAKVEPLAVGYYDPNTGQMDVAPWSDVKQLLKAASE